MSPTCHGSAAVEAPPRVRDSGANGSKFSGGTGATMQKRSSRTHAAMQALAETNM